MTIKNPFSLSPIITKKIYSAFFYFKLILVVLILSVACAAGIYFKIQYDENVIITNKIKEEKHKASNAETGVVIDATADIISKEGNLPISVAKKYAMWIYEAGAKHNVDPVLILSVMAVESKFNYRAISPTGPVGLLQVAYHWHKEKTSKAALFDPKNNIDVGTQILKEYSNRSSTETETLLRYNGSLGHPPVYALKVLSKKRSYENEIMESMVKSI